MVLSQPPLKHSMSPKIAESVIHIKLGAFDIHWSAVDGQRLAFTPGAHVRYGGPPVDQWCHCISCGPTACIVSTRVNCCWHPLSRQHRDTCLISLGLPGQQWRPWTWSSSLYFPHQSSMPWAWRYTPPGCLQWKPGHQQREAPMTH